VVAARRAPQPTARSDRKKLLESKEDMEKRQIRSPDLADALALTFADTVTPRSDSDLPSSANEPPSRAGY
jgi:hypothetical protein